MVTLDQGSGHTWLVPQQPEDGRASVSGRQSEMRRRLRQRGQVVFVATAVLPREQRTHFTHVEVITTLRIPAHK